MRPLRIPRFVCVVGNSMFPTYKEDNVLFCIPTPFKHIKEGDVIIYIPPDDGERVVIKRVEAKSSRTCSFFCLGDNSADSHDSRDYGFIPYRNVLGKVYPQRKRGEKNG